MITKYILSDVFGNYNKFSINKLIYTYECSDLNLITLCYDAFVFVLFILFVCLFALVSFW